MSELTNKPIYDRVAIIGLGLIGSSMARGISEYRLAKHIVGCDLNELSLAYAKKHSFLHETFTSPQEAVSNCDLIILATPPSALKAITKDIAKALKQEAVIMDVCSVKEAAIESILPYLPTHVHFIPAHPIAGSEQTGAMAGQGDLFERKRVILTPAEPRQDEVIQKIHLLWKGLGARCEAMPPHLHDMVYAYISHLPQLLAFASGRVLEEYGDVQAENDTLKKFLRLSHSNPHLWMELFLLNRDNMLKSLDRYLDAVIHIRKELAQAPEDTPLTLENNELVLSRLFPRIASSCLITTVMEAEKQVGFPFARYAGTGFADFTFPATQPPEEDLENISSSYPAVAEALESYITILQQARAALSEGRNRLFLSQ